MIFSKKELVVQVQIISQDGFPVSLFNSVTFLISFVLILLNFGGQFFCDEHPGTCICLIDDPLFVSIFSPLSFFLFFLFFYLSIG